MIHSGKFSRAWRTALGGSVALFLVIGCPPPGRSQRAAIRTPDDIREGIRKGSLFYAVAPLSEQALRRLDGTAHEASFTMPLTVDRVHNRLFVEARINGHRVHLILDTGGGPGVGLDEATARGITLTGKIPIQLSGSQGTEPVTLGLARSLTLGRLTLGGVATTVSRTAPFYSSTLGTEIFKRYRVTLDFAAKTMTLARGGVVTPPSRSAALLMPFDDRGGYIFVPVRVLDQSGWAVLDSGSDATCVSFQAAKAAATQLSLSDAKTVVITQKIGMGETDKKVTALVLKVPVPISMNTGIENPEFNTTSRIGTSDIDDVLGPGLDAPATMNAQLGLPFLLQFQRVTIDYPHHTLILQHPARNIYVKVPSSPTGRDKPWPGYKWLQKGYAWIEVPDGKSAPSPAPVNASSQTATTQTTTVTQKTGTRTTTILPPANDGTVTVIVNGVNFVYPYPLGSGIKIDTDGSVRIVPPPGGAGK